MPFISCAHQQSRSGAARKGPSNRRGSVATVQVLARPRKKAPVEAEENAALVNA
jgi:hypothetical protein